MASATRTIWKGAISFGLVHIPVGLHTATTESGVDFDWLDKRSMDPVGYKRINKRTGKEIGRENIVKGVEYQAGKYVVLSQDEINDAYPRTTQTIEIERFVNADAVSFVYLERPYYIAPINKGQKVYALLRDTLFKTGKIAIARVVIQTKQHLAALIPAGDALVLNLMRWGEDVKSTDELALPAVGAKGTSASASELKMAKMLIDDMSGDWNPDEFKDEFKHAIMSLVEKRARAGKTQTVFEPQERAPAHADNVIDLTALLQQSLRNRGGAKTAAKKTKTTKTTKRISGPAASVSTSKTATTSTSTASAKAKTTFAKRSVSQPTSASKAVRQGTSTQKAAKTTVDRRKAA